MAKTIAFSDAAVTFGTGTEGKGGDSYSQGYKTSTARVT